MPLLKSINWIFTYKCNLKCQHCDIWDHPYQDEIDIEALKNILSSQLVQKSYQHYGPDVFDISLSGGEPLMIPNLTEVMDTIESYIPGSLHCISTNGVLIKPLIKTLLHWKKQGQHLRKINISIDGAQINHDTQRGVPGIFKKTVKNIATIRKVFPDQAIEIKLTITKINYRDIHYISKLADKLGIFFSFKPVENMHNYTNQNSSNDTKFSAQEIDIIEDQIRGNAYIEKQDFYINKRFFETIPNYLRAGLGEKKRECQVANESLTLLPDGKVYSCILMNQTGDLNTQSLDEIWEGNLIQAQRGDIKAGKCPECMLMCGSFKSKQLF